MKRFIGFLLVAPFCLCLGVGIYAVAKSSPFFQGLLVLIVLLTMFRIGMEILLDG